MGDGGVSIPPGASLEMHFGKRWRDWARMRPEVKALLGKVWKCKRDLNRMRTEAAALLGKVATEWLLFFMFFSYSSSRICWAPMWVHYGRKD